MSETQIQTSATSQQPSYAQNGLMFSRRYSTEGVSPYDDFQWEKRTASITDAKGNTDGLLALP